MTVKPQDYRKWFELLSRTIEELNNFPPGGDLYAFMAGTLKQIAPEDAIILVNSFDYTTKTITNRAVEGLGSRMAEVGAILGQPLKGLTLPVPANLLPEMLTGECNEIPGGLTGLSFGLLPCEACEKIETMPFFGKVYGAGISWQDRLNGSAIFILPPGTGLENHDLITFFIRQVARVLSRREAETALKESERFNKEIILNAKEGIVVYDRNFNYLVWNPFMESLTGVSLPEALGKNAFDLFPHLKEQGVDVLLQRVLKGETAKSRDMPFHVPKTKKTGWVSGIYCPHIDSTGEIIGIIGNIRDITERVLVEEALRESEDRLKKILDHLPSGVIIVDAVNHRIIDANQRAVEMSGFSKTAIIGKVCHQFICPAEEGHCPITDLGQTVDNAERVLLTATGSRLPIIKTVIQVGFGGHDVLIETFLDITERKRAEEEVRQTRQNYEIFFNTIDEFLCVIDGQGLILYANETINRRLGYTGEELPGQPVLVLYPPEQREEAGRIVGEMLSGTINSCMLPLMTRDGQLIPVETRVTRGEWDQRPVLFVVAKDLSELKISEEKFSAAFHSSAALMAISTKQDGKFIDVNETFLDKLGFSRDEIIGKHVSELNIFLDPADRLHALHMQEERGVVRDLEVPVRTKDGSALYGLFSVENILIGAVPCLLTTMVDITDQKILEKEMEFHEQEVMQFSRSLDMAIRKLNLLSSITRHDINNQLTVLMGYLEMLEVKIPDRSFDEYFRRATTAAQRISAMIRFTKTYESIGVIAPSWQNIRSVADTAAKEAPLGQVVLKNDLPAGAVMFADPLVAKVFYNLMENAVRYGEKITTIRLSVQGRDGSPVIVCEDDGNGISSGEKEMIFERGYGKNTGLGLFLTREILGITGISIRETGEPGKGARFEIAVPEGAYRINP